MHGTYSVKYTVLINYIHLLCQCHHSYAVKHKTTVLPIDNSCLPAGGKGTQVVYVTPKHAAVTQ